MNQQNQQFQPIVDIAGGFLQSFTVGTGIAIALVVVIFALALKKN